MNGEPIRPCPKPVRAEKPKRWGTRRRKRPEPKTAALAFPRPVSPDGSSHRRRPREWGRLKFLSEQRCDVPQAFRAMFGHGIVLSPARTECSRGRSQVMHLGARKGYRPPDDQCQSGCRHHHEDIDQARHWFLALSDEDRAAFVRFLYERGRRAWDALTPEQRADYDARAAAEHRRPVVPSGA